MLHISGSEDTLLTNTGEKLNKCAECKKSFGQAGVLKDLITIFEWATEDLQASSVKIEDYLWILSAVTLRTSPPHQEGFESLPAGGFVSQGSRRSPPHQEGFESLPAGGFASRARAQGSRRPPTRQEGYLPLREVALMHGGQNPITLE